MIALRLLGSPDLRGIDGRVLGPALALPRRLALLVYLAAAPPGRLHTRESLAVLLWPESTPEHARSALRQSLYVLRHAVGEDVLVTYGDAVLGVDPTKLWCDVGAFDSAMAVGDDAAALTLYRGPFLDGFHISAAPEFERWTERTRARLAAAATAAAWRLVDAEERGDDPQRALCWMQRLLEMRPDDERAVQRTLALLLRLGDRLGAMRLYDEFARRLDEDYELRPSPSTRALIASLHADVPVRESDQLADPLVR